MPNPDDYMTMHKFVNMNSEPTSNTTLGGVPVDEVCLGAALVALTCSKQSDMVNTTDRKCKLDLKADPKATEEYAQRLANECYADRAKHRLDEKRKKEAEAHRQTTIMSALAANCPDTLDEKFCDALTKVGMTSRSAQGMDKFEKLLAKGDWPLKQRKIMTLLTGRNPSGKVVWANGNVCTLIPAVFRNFFKEDATGTLLARVKSFRKLQGHVYSESRTGVNTNRHGYNTDHPTLKGMGYATLSEFQDQDPEAATMWLKRRVEERLAIERKKMRSWYNYSSLQAMKDSNPDEYYAKAFERTRVALARYVLCQPKKKNNKRTGDVDDTDEETV